MRTMEKKKRPTAKRSAGKVANLPKLSTAEEEIPSADAMHCAASVADSSTVVRMPDRKLAVYGDSGLSFFLAVFAQRFCFSYSHCFSPDCNL